MPKENQPKPIIKTPNSNNVPGQQQSSVDKPSFIKPPASPPKKK